MTFRSQRYTNGAEYAHKNGISCANKNRPRFTAQAASYETIKMISHKHATKIAQREKPTK